MAVAIIGLAGCTRPAPRRSLDPLNYARNLEQIESAWCIDRSGSGGPPLPSAPPLASSPEPDLPNARRWARLGDDRTAGYVLVRGAEATVVDTASWCTADVIETALNAVDLGWPAVGSIIVTHKHPDHWVGLSEALERAEDATVFAGAADIPHIVSPRPVTAVGAGDRVMDLAIIPTPGHTPGHIAVHDAAAGVLVVGDALYASRDGMLDMLPSSEDMEGARASLRSLAGLSFDTLLPGHGFPIIGGAWKALNDYIAEGGT